MQEKVLICPGDDYNSVMGKLVEKGTAMLLESLKLIEAGDAVPLQQSPGKYRYAAAVTRDDMKIDLNGKASRVINTVRAFPGKAWIEACVRKGKPSILKITRAGGPFNDDAPCKNFSPGQIMEANRDGWVSVKCADGYVRIESVRAESRSECSAYDYVNGARLRPGDNLYGE